MNAELWALILAVAALGLGAASRRRERPAGTRTRAQSVPYWLVPLGIIVGLLPRVLRLGEAVKLAGSVSSLIMSFTAIVLMTAGSRKA
jgi:hypothetical protein